MIQRIQSILFLIQVFLVVLFLSILTHPALGQIKTSNEQSFIKADFVEYDAPEDYIYASGNIEVMTDEYLITAEKLIYDIQKDILIAQHKVKIVDKQNHVIYGESIYFRDKLKNGIVKNFIAKFSDNSIFASRLASRVDEHRTDLCNSNFTPCKVVPGRRPIWQISAKYTHIDLERQKAIYNNVFFRVYGIPIFFTPYFSHPLPKAAAQSGLLVPVIKRDDLMLPIYFRLKNNIDATITPRLSKKYVIYEGEFRHKIDNGYYSLTGSQGKVPYALKNKEGELIKKTKVNSFHLFANGSFKQNNYYYGFNLAKTSDKAYLKNYYNLHNPYLLSKLYVNKIEDYDYLQLESLYFQGLRIEDNTDNNALVLPRAKNKNVFNLNDDETTRLIVSNDALYYREPYGKQLARESLELALDKQYIFDNGCLMNLQGSSRNELYLINQISPSNNLKVEPIQNPQKIKTKVIPELAANWRYPFIGIVGNNLNFSFEPIMLINTGLNFQQNYNKYNLIDAGRFELSDDNLFKSNHFNGIDYHEYGQRVAYGANSGIFINDKYLTFFIGQLHYKHNNVAVNKTGEIVGRTAIDFNNKFNLFYRFRKNREYEPIRDELGLSYHGEKLYLNSSYVKLQNLKRYYSTNDNFNFTKDNAKQAYYNVRYQLTPNMTVGNEVRIDLSSKKMPLLYRSIRVTYRYDCVSIGAKFYDDYTSDSIRGIKKTSTKTISVGLKVLNM